MPMWSNTDAAGNSAIFAPAQYNKAPTAANRNALFGNTTAGAYHTGETIGMYGISRAEAAGSRSGIIDAITITTRGTSYTARPTVSIAAPDLVNGVQATATLVGEINTAVINNPGTSGSYVPGDVLTTAGGTGTQGTVNVDTTEVRTVAIQVAGSGYSNGDVVTATTGTGTKATYTVTTGAADTIPASLALTTRGSYTVNPTLSAAATTVAPAGGTGLTVNHTMRVKSVAIITRGAWTVLPSLTNTPTGGSGTGATLTLTIGAGPATMTEKGSGYNTAPELTFGGTGGTGTVGVATVKSTSAGVTNPGWAIRTEGSGGRAGRVKWETLVAMGSISGDASDDSILPE